MFCFEVGHFSKVLKTGTWENDSRLYLQTKNERKIMMERSMAFGDSWLMLHKWVGYGKMVYHSLHV
jgi:hypothetical protein